MLLLFSLLATVLAENLDVYVYTSEKSTKGIHNKGGDFVIDTQPSMLHIELTNNAYYIKSDDKNYLTLTKDHLHLSPDKTPWILRRNKNLSDSTGINHYQLENNSKCLSKENGILSARQCEIVSEDQQFFLVSPDNSVNPSEVSNFLNGAIDAKIKLVDKAIAPKIENEEEADLYKILIKRSVVTVTKTVQIQEVPSITQKEVATGVSPTANVEGLTRGKVPRGMVPSGMVPSGMVPSDIVPSGMIPRGMIPRGMISPGEEEASMEEISYEDTPLESRGEHARKRARRQLPSDRRRMSRKLEPGLGESTSVSESEYESVSGGVSESEYEASEISEREAAKEKGHMEAIKERAYNEFASESGARFGESAESEEATEKTTGLITNILAGLNPSIGKESKDDIEKAFKKLKSEAKAEKETRTAMTRREREERAASMFKEERNEREKELEAQLGIEGEALSREERAKLEREGRFNGMSRAERERSERASGMSRAERERSERARGMSRAERERSERARGMSRAERERAERAEGMENEEHERKERERELEAQIGIRGGKSREERAKLEREGRAEGMSNKEFRQAERDGRTRNMSKEEFEHEKQLELKAETSVSGGTSNEERERIKREGRAGGISNEEFRQAEREGRTGGMSKEDYEHKMQFELETQINVSGGKSREERERIAKEGRVGGISNEEFRQAEREGRTGGMSKEEFEHKMQFEFETQMSLSGGGSREEHEREERVRRQFGGYQSSITPPTSTINGGEELEKRIIITARSGGIPADRIQGLRLNNVVGPNGQPPIYSTTTTMLPPSSRSPPSSFNPQQPPNPFVPPSYPQYGPPRV